MPTANPKNKIQWRMPLIYLMVFVSLWYWFQSASKVPEPKQISYSEFLSEVRAGHVSDVRIDEQRLIAKLKTDPSKTEAAKEISTQRLPAMDETPLLKDLEAPRSDFLRSHGRVVMVESCTSMADTDSVLRTYYRLR
jgi:ATP-dependent Zn protease